MSIPSRRKPATLSQFFRKSTEPETRTVTGIQKFRQEQAEKERRAEEQRQQRQSLPQLGK